VRAESTSIPGLLRVELTVHGDARGRFTEGYQRAKLTAAGMPDLAVVQSNVSYNAEPGVTRGIHGEPWNKYVTVVHGRAFAAIVDLRAGAGFGRVQTVELHPGNALYIPRGCGNSYQTLTPDVVYTYLVDAYFSPDALYTHVDAYDPALGIDWPIGADAAIRSAKDLGHPPLAAVQPMPCG
jgi:dTDP-4-dehydrorhamnose 3,5-epimerase